MQIGISFIKIQLCYEASSLKTSGKKLQTEFLVSYLHQRITFGFFKAVVIFRKHHLENISFSGSVK